jgi:hypothetical protein
MLTVTAINSKLTKSAAAINLIMQPSHGEAMARQTRGAIVFALNFLWLLSFFQEK